MPRTAARSRRARGTGSIFYHEGRGRWVGRLPVGRTPEGRTVYRECSAPTQAELVKLLADLKPPGPDTTVAQWADRWLKSVTVRASTFGDYRNTMKKFVVPTLGHLRLRDLTAGQVEHAARKWADRLNANCVRKNIGQLRNCLECARRLGVILTNPARDARKPKPSRRRLTPLTADELARVIAGATLPHLYPFALLAATGCRMGEALGLDVGHYDPKAGTLSITRTWSRKHGFRPPKSENGVRTIPVPAALVPVLVATINGRKSGAMFPTWPTWKVGRRQHTSVGDGWKKYERRLGLTPHRNPHQLRHSWASHAIANGVPIADVAKYLGDAVDTIVRTYCHPTGASPVAWLDALTNTVKCG